MEAAFFTAQDRKIPLSLLPSNVRNHAQLQSSVEQSNDSATTSVYTATGTLKEQMDRAEKTAIKQALSQAFGNRTLAAKQLGISKSTLYEKLSKHQLA
jgi:transcriptional regulator with PAS, ATPase and Fis domain